MNFKNLTFILLIETVVLSSCNISNNQKNTLSLNTEIDTSSIQFKYQTLEDAIEMSRKQNLPVFIYFTADGCGPCVKMDRTVFPDSTVMNFFNQNFICVKSHRKRFSNTGIVTDEEKKLNNSIDEINKIYGIYGTPSFIVIDFNGKLIHKEIGYMNQQQLIQFGKDALSDNDNYAAIEKRINDGDYSFETVKAYLSGTSTPSSFGERISTMIFGTKRENVIENYFKTQSQSNWNSVNNWFLIEEYIDDFESKQFQYLLQNSDQFYKNFGKIKVNSKIYHILAQYEFNGGDIKNLNCPIAELIINKNHLKSQNISDLNVYAEKYNDIYTQYYYLFDYEINNVSWHTYEESKKDSDLIENKTIKIVTNWMSLVSSYRNEDKNYRDTYEKLQNQLSKYE